MNGDCPGQRNFIQVSAVVGDRAFIKQDGDLLLFEIYANNRAEIAIEYFAVVVSGVKGVGEADTGSKAG